MKKRVIYEIKKEKPVRNIKHPPRGEMPVLYKGNWITYGEFTEILKKEQQERDNDND